MMTYVRLRVEGKTIYLQNPVEVMLLGEPCISGIEVNHDGDEISGKDFDQRQQIIQKSLIARRTPMRMNLHYGMLEEDK